MNHDPNLLPADINKLEDFKRGRSLFLCVLIVQVTFLTFNSESNLLFSCGKDGGTRSFERFTSCPKTRRRDHVPKYAIDCVKAPFLSLQLKRLNKLFSKNQ